MLYPVLFTPIYKETVWGGDRLKNWYQRKTPYEHTGESWDITCRPGEMGIIENGPDAGLTFDAWAARGRADVWGTRLAMAARFPLLIKIIDAQDNLSVQVHPGDAYAQAHGKNAGDTGKNEMWYVMEAPADGRLIIGLKDGVTAEVLRKASETGEMEPCLYYLPVRRGDIINIPAGLVHALTRGVIVAEVQQNSDITYRLFDYNRLGLDGKPRELHVEDSLSVTDFEQRIPKTAVPGLRVEKDGAALTYAVGNPYFAAIKYELNGAISETSDPSAFYVFTCVEGDARITAGGREVTVPPSRSVFVPAGLGAYTWQGRGILLKSFVPDVRKDFAAPLLAAGYNEADIRGNTAYFV